MNNDTRGVGSGDLLGDFTTVHPLKVGDPLRGRACGHLWVVCEITRVGHVCYRRYENGWHVGWVARKDADLHFTKPRISA